jgi:hypothetical protein
MSVNAILDTTLALRRRVAAAAGGAIFVGPPVRGLMGNKTVSLFLFQAEASRDLRNVERRAPAKEPGPFESPAERWSALPLDLRYMISAFRTAGAGPDSDPDELGRLGSIISALHAEPTLTETEVEGQTVRVTLEPASLDDLNRVWGIFPEESYQTSVIYLATPVWVEAGPIRVGPPVLEHEQRAGVSTAPPVFVDEAAA